MTLEKTSGTVFSPDPTSVEVRITNGGGSVTINGYGTGDALIASESFTVNTISTVIDLTNIDSTALTNVKKIKFESSKNFDITNLTLGTAAAAPTVTTQAVSSVGSTTATGNGNITSLGSQNPTSYGVCWNTAGTPTTSDSKVDLGSASAAGAFTADITGLAASTTYYVRAYATNAVGTSYGDTVSFTTLPLYWKDYAASGYEGGSGTSGDPYLISSAEQLAYFSNQVNAGNTYNGKYFKLTADISLAGKRWTPIGSTTANYFDGTFNGYGHIVSSMNVIVSTSSEDALAGLFGHVLITAL